MLLSNPQFSYVYFFRSDGIIHTQWIRYHVTKIPKLLEEFSENWNCYTTIQHYGGPSSVEGENKIAPLYFDLDVAPKDGKIDLNAAIKDTKKIIAFFAQLGIDEQFIRVWFSGQKGFHIAIHPECMAIGKHPDISYIMRLATDFLADFLGLTTYDHTVYSKRRMWRLPNTKHLKTGFYCVELYHGDLESGQDKIRELATEPRDDLYDKAEYDKIETNDTAADWFNKFWQNYLDYSDMEKLGKKNVVQQKTKGMPVCMQHLEEVGLKQPGSRNGTAIAMTSYLFNSGCTEKNAITKMVRWAKSIPASLTNTDELQRISGAISTVRSIYHSDNKYFHSCDYVRSLGNGAPTPMPCDREKCKYVNTEDQTTEEAISVTLKESRRSAFIGKKIKFDAFCGAKDGAPFWVPQHGGITCTPQLSDGRSICHNCGLKPGIKPEIEGEPKQVYEEQVKDFSLASSSSAIVEMTGQKTGSHYATIKRIMGVPKQCTRSKIDVANHVNVERVILNPVVGFENDITEDEEAYESIKNVAYVVNKDMKPNQNYTFTGQSMPDPKNSYCINVIETAEPKDSDIDNFEMTPEIYEELKIFQGDPTEKFKEIHDDLENNVHNIWERRPMAIGLDLIYHSALGFKFDGQWVDRGWVQGVFVGDTGQAKSKMAIEIMKHYRCGDFMNCETAGRTGILYNISKVNESWHLKYGKMVTQDRMLLILDELQQLDPQTITELGGAREHGFVTVDMVESGRAKTRVRMAMIANPRFGRIEAMNFGVEAVKGLFQSPKDLRRCDFAMTLSANEVPIEILNKRVRSDITPIYTSDRCSNLIKWIWSRRRDQIVFTEEAVQDVLEQAVYFGTKYQCNIPLCEHGDMRFKIARMATAVAGRVFSTEDGHTLVIRPEHVLFLKEYLDKIYSAYAMAFDRYAKIDQERNHLDEKRFKILSTKIKQMKDYHNMCHIFLETITFSIATMSDATDIDYTEMKSLFALLRKRRFLEQNIQGKNYKTPAFTKLLKRLLDEIEEEEEEAAF